MPTVKQTQNDIEYDVDELLSKVKSEQEQINSLLNALYQELNDIGFKA